MTSKKVPTLEARIEHWPIEGNFTISRGAKTEAVVVVAKVTYGNTTGRGECVPYPRYGETPEATLAAILGMKDAIGRELNREALQAAMPPSAARNALDCALLDLEAKQIGIRIWDRLRPPAPPPPATPPPTFPSPPIPSRSARRRRWRQRPPQPRTGRSSRSSSAAKAIAQGSPP